MNDSYVEKSIDSGRIGAAVEHLVAASCILASGGALNVSTSLVDDEGVDLVFHRRGSPTTLAVQVKSRSKDTSVVQRGQFVAYVRPQTFSPRRGLYMLFVVVDRPTATLETVWLVPSDEFDALAGTTGRGLRRITASLKPDSRDQWRRFRMPLQELPGAILEALDQLDNPTAV
jgi:hypothetical protein